MSGKRKIQSVLSDGQPISMSKSKPQRVFSDGQPTQCIKNKQTLEREDLEDELIDLQAEIEQVNKINKEFQKRVNGAEAEEKARKNFPKLENPLTVYSDDVEGCGVCRKPKNEWKEIKETNPWYSRGHYNEGRYSTWNPYFNEQRIYRPFCYECWCRHHDLIMCCGAWTDAGHVTYVVTNWPHDRKFKVWRETAQKWDETATFWGHQWNDKDEGRYDPWTFNQARPSSPHSPSPAITVKSREDLEKEQEHVQYARLIPKEGELFIHVKIDTYSYKLVRISLLEEWNPHLPKLKFRFPNRVPFETLLAALPKQSYENHISVGYFAWLTKWYDASV